MSKKNSRKQWEEKCAAERARKKDLLQALYQGEHHTVILNSITWGEIEVWNFIECNRQNAEDSKGDEVAHMECALCDESKEVGEFFRKHGFNF
jgi:hypothetical protein